MEVKDNISLSLPKYAFWDRFVQEASRKFDLLGSALSAAFRIYATDKEMADAKSFGYGVGKKRSEE